MNNNSILITGGTGLLGFSLVRNNYNAYKIISTYHNYFPAEILKDYSYYYLDLNDTAELKNIFKKIKPRIVIHTAGIGNVDFCEKNPEKTNVINVSGSLAILEETIKIDAKFIFVSSNAVFDGEHAPYSENDILSPVNVYGKQKQIVEEEIKKSAKNWVIVRPILMYGWNLPRIRDNSVTWVLKSLKRGKKLKIVNDIFCNPLLADDCALAIWEIIDKEKNGIYHVAGADRIDRYQFALLTAEIFHLDAGLIEPVANDYFPSIAPRPKDTTYDISKLTTELKLKVKGIKEGLQYMYEHKPTWGIE